jgi:hypothetical protein
MKTTLFKIKKHFAAHQTQYAWTTAALATTAVIILRIGLSEHDDFLREKGLYEEFYLPE